MNAYRVFTVCFLLIIPGLYGCASKDREPLGLGAEASTSAISAAVYPLPFETMWNETRTVFRYQRIAITGQRKEDGRGTLKGKTVEQREVTVELFSHGANDTAVTVQVGAIPDREAASALQRIIARRVYVVLSSPVL
ncbi:MAG: DUF3568 family protein [Gammaproteobacteria bacterium]